MNVDDCAHRSWTWEPTKEELADLNGIRKRVGLPTIADGQIRTSAAWQKACNEIDELQCRCCERCGQPMPPDWDYAWCKACGETGTCRHGNRPHECNDCFIESDIAFDARREGAVAPTRSDDPDE